MSDGDSKTEETLVEMVYRWGDIERSLGRWPPEGPTDIRPMIDWDLGMAVDKAFRVEALVADEYDDFQREPFEVFRYRLLFNVEDRDAREAAKLVRKKTQLLKKLIADEWSGEYISVDVRVCSSGVPAELATEHSDRVIWWLHGARSSRDHSFAAEARALLASLPNVRTHVCYSRPRPDDLEGRDFDSAGRLSASLLAELEPPRNAEAYLYGPTPFMEEISPGLAAIGLGGTDIHTEPFGPAPGLTPGIAATPTRTPHPPAGERGAGPTIEFARSNLAVPWSDDYPSLLELAEACDVPVRWSCRTGVCHNCETTLIAGTIEYNPDPVEPPADGSALICCSQPHDDVVLDL